MKNLFAYGTLLVPEIWRAVVGKEFPSEPAFLPGYEIRRVKDADYPGIQPLLKSKKTVTGRVFLGLDDESLNRLDAYEGDLYYRQEVSIVAAKSPKVAAETYVIAPNSRHLLSDSEWTIEWFLREAFGTYIEKIQHQSKPN